MIKNLETVAFAIDSAINSLDSVKPNLWEQGYVFTHEELETIKKELLYASRILAKTAVSEVITAKFN